MLDRSFLAALAAFCLLFPAAAQEKSTPSVPPILDDRVLFDFEEEDALAGWSNLESLGGAKEPPAKIALSSEHASSGRKGLKITFAGGQWPTLTTHRVSPDWAGFHILRADITVSRPCVVGITVMQEKNRTRGDSYCRTFFLQPGRNEVLSPLTQFKVTGIGSGTVGPEKGNVTAFDLFMYSPHEGESITVDHIRLSAQKWAPPARQHPEFRVLGTDMVVSGSAHTNIWGVTSVEALEELFQKLKSQWVPPTPRTVEQVEAEFGEVYGTLKREHPKAVLALLRDGEKGPDGKVYDGWRDAYFSSHGPEAAKEARSRNQGKESGTEIFMRHRAPLMKVDLSAIPQGSTILAAKLIIVRAVAKYSRERDPLTMPNLWTVEPCNRPWEEYEANAFQYAKDKFWKSIGGMYSYSDPDPDFLPIFLAYGPGQGVVNTWDFTQAVKFWTDGKHPNHGFMLHCSLHDFIYSSHTRESAELKSRPAVLVIYEPKR